MAGMSAHEIFSTHGGRNIRCYLQLHGGRLPELDAVLNPPVASI
jgi:hypothetical protein